MSKSKAAFEFSAERLGKEQLYFWTFTFAEVLDVKDTRKKWNHLLTLLRRHYPKLCGLRAFELHEEHGLHVHLVTNGWINVDLARAMANKAGWGRIHVKRIPSTKAGYLGKYLSKEHRSPCFKGWRLWAAFGPWGWIKNKDVAYQSEYGTILKAIISAEKRPQNHFDRLALADKLYFNTLSIHEVSK